MSEMSVSKINNKDNQSWITIRNKSGYFIIHIDQEVEEVETRGSNINLKTKK